MKKSWWRYFGPGFIISVAYFDPGNWATDIQAGSQFYYSLLWVITLASIMGIFVQILAAKLGIATGEDLCTLCRKHYSKPIHLLLFLTAVIAIMATDLAEIIGVAVALHLLFDISLLLGAIITFFDVMLILLFNRWGFRIVETIFLTFLATVSFIYLAEVWLSNPNLALIAYHSVIPTSTAWSNPTAIFITVGIIGATIMPHSVYLHSYLMLGRLKEEKLPAKQIHYFGRIDTTLSLIAAWFINAGILIVSAAVFHPIFVKDGTVIASFQDAHQTLIPLLGSWAAVFFAIALLCSGVAASTCATLAGQAVFEGFLKIQGKHLFLIRLGIRTITMLPAVLCIVFHTQPITVLLWSQVILSLQLPFAIYPLLRFTNDKKLMGSYVNKPWVRILGWIFLLVIVVLNAILIYQTFA